MAGEAEAQRHWDVAIERLTEALALADDKASVRIRIEALRREIGFEKSLAENVTYASMGDWTRSLKALQSAAAMLPKDPRVSEARARMPRRLVEAWLDGARARLPVLPHGPVQQAMLRRIAVLRARMGDLPGAHRLLREESNDAAVRIIGFAQAASASIRAGKSEGLRPYLDKTYEGVSQIADPEMNGRAALEMGRTFTLYGDTEMAGKSLHQALESFMQIDRKRRQNDFPITETSLDSDSVTGSGVFSRRPRTTRMVTDQQRQHSHKANYIAEVARTQAAETMVGGRLFGAATVTCTRAAALSIKPQRTL